LILLKNTEDTFRTGVMGYLRFANKEFREMNLKQVQDAA